MIALTTQKYTKFVLDLWNKDQSPTFSTINTNVIILFSLNFCFKIKTYVYILIFSFFLFFFLLEHYNSILFL